MARRATQVSDIVFPIGGGEIINGKFEELENFPINPFRGQLVHITNAIVGSKVFCYNGSQWICGATSINGRQGDITLSKDDVDLPLVDNIKQQPWSQVLTNISNDLSTPVSLSSDDDEQIRSLAGGIPFNRTKPYYLYIDVDGKWNVSGNINMNQVTGSLDLTGAASPTNLDILQYRTLGGWVNRSPVQYKIDLGLENVNNTPDNLKPVSAAQAAADTASRARSNHTGTQLSNTISDFSATVDGRIGLQKATASGLATLDINGKIPSVQMPSIAITSTYVVNNLVAHLALNATTQEGDVVVRTDLPATFIKNSGTTGTITDWTQLPTPTDTVLSVNGYTGIVVLSKADIGLDRVNNTNDLEKPVSTATQAAIAAAIAARRFSMVLPAMANNSSYTVVHNLGTTRVLCGFMNATSKEAARMNWRASTANTVTVTTDVAIAPNEVEIVIQA